MFFDYYFLKLHLHFFSKVKSHKEDLVPMDPDPNPGVPETYWSGSRSATLDFDMIIKYFFVSRWGWDWRPPATWSLPFSWPAPPTTSCWQPPLSKTFSSCWQELPTPCSQCCGSLTFCYRSVPLTNGYRSATKTFFYVFLLITFTDKKVWKVTKE
jgi:hypothetical protein